MGKGDKRTQRGKLWRNSYGKTRQKKNNKPLPKEQTIQKQTNR